MKTLTAFQPSGTLHIGNYFGAIKPVLNFSGDKFVFVANLHSLTTIHNASVLSKNTESLILDLYALGLTNLWIQSDVPEVLELSWLLSSILNVSYLERSHSFKDKLNKGLTANVALFNYPVLMASDILLLQPDVVIVGKDQVQHLEILEEASKKFEQSFDFSFKLPEKQISNISVLGIDGQKMSKSYGNIIPIFCSRKELNKICSKIVTDSKVVDEPKDPNTCLIFQLYCLFANLNEVERMKQLYTKECIGYGVAKMMLSEKIWNYFEEYRIRRIELEDYRTEIFTEIKDNGSKIRKNIQSLLKEIKKSVGL